MLRKRMLVLALGLTLLCGCGPGGKGPVSSPTPTPDPEPTPTPAAGIEWLHGFYASSSYSQLELTGDMEAVSLGWGRMYIDEAGAPFVDQGDMADNQWVVPEGAELVTGYLEERGIPYNLCVFAGTRPYGDTNVLEYIISPEVRERTVEALTAAAEGYSGVTVDFEGLRHRESREDMTAFMTLLREKLPADKLLYIAVPPDDWYKGYDYRGLGAVCDKVILMAHSYQWTRVEESKLGTGDTNTPLAPIGRVEKALRDITDRKTGVEDRSKIVLAISFGSAGLIVEEDEDILAGEALLHPGMSTLARRLQQEDAVLGWSELYQAPYVFYHDEEGIRYKVWYEDARSVKAKVELALSYGVSGVSLWRLGTVPAEPEAPYFDVWTALLGEKTEK